MHTIVILFSLFISHAAIGTPNAILLRSIAIIDGTGSEKTFPLDIEIIGNKISRIGSNIKNPRAIIIDGKITREKGFGPFEIWPIFDESFRSAIVLEARKYNSPLFIHSLASD